MSEKPVISPDGRFVLVNGEWLELAQQNVSLTDSVISGDVSMSSTVNINTRSPSEEITNLAELAVVKLSNGDMAAAKEVYTEAKKIDVSIAMDTFENKYATKIGFSDHSGEIFAPLAAVTLGAEIIETHLVFHKECFK